MTTAPFKRTLLDAMASVLRPAGFRKKAAVFSRERGEVVQLVQLQSSTSSTASLLNATVNVAVWVPALSGLYGKPDVAAAHWSHRLGQLLDPPIWDQWWSMASSADAEASSAEIAQALQSSALPALDVVATHADLIRLWQSGRSPGLTKGKADDCLARLLSRAEGPTGAVPSRRSR